MDKPGKGKTSSMVTIFAIVNIMVGSVVLLLPVNFFLLNFFTISTIIF